MSKVFIDKLVDKSLEKLENNKLEKLENNKLENLDIVVVGNIVEVVDRILKFSEFLCEVKLYSYQKPFARRVIYSVITGDGEEITALFSRQSGKTEAVAVVIVGLCIILPKLIDLGVLNTDKFKRGLWVGLFAPTNEQVDTMFSRCKGFLNRENAIKVLADRELNLDVNSKKKIIEFSNGSIIRMSSADKNANIESKTYHIAVSDESQDVNEEKQRKSINPMLTATNGSRVRLGTPNGKLCDFKLAIEINKERDYKITKTNNTNNKSNNTNNKTNNKSNNNTNNNNTNNNNINNTNNINKSVAVDDEDRLNTELLINHFENDWLVCAKENENYRKFVTKELEKYGEDDPFFRMSYALDWDFNVGKAFTSEMFDSMLDPKLDIRDYGNGIYSAGIDFAKDVDSTVLTILAINDNGRKDLVRWVEFKGENYKEQFDRMIEILNYYRTVERIAFDVNGVGRAMTDMFIDYFMDLGVIVVEVNFTPKSKSNIYQYLFQEVNEGKLKIPYNKEVSKSNEFKKFKKECLTLRKEWKNGLLKCFHGTKKDDHDDYPDSLALANWAGKDLIMSNIEFDNYDIFRNSESKNIRKQIVRKLF